MLNFFLFDSLWRDICATLTKMLNKVSVLLLKWKEDAMCLQAEVTRTPSLATYGSRKVENYPVRAWLASRVNTL